MRRFSVGLVLVLSGQLMAPHQAVAEGALAIGTDGKIAENGVAVGSVINEPTRDVAVSVALQTCRDSKAAPKMGPLCHIVGTFRRECVSVAYDPKDGTPGEGWAFGPDEATAQSRAMATCQATAGLDRSQYCVVAQSRCDTSE